MGALWNLKSRQKGAQLSGEKQQQQEEDEEEEKEAFGSVELCVTSGFFFLMQ